MNRQFLTLTVLFCAGVLAAVALFTWQGRIGGPFAVVVVVPVVLAGRWAWVGTTTQTESLKRRLDQAGEPTQNPSAARS